MRCAMRLQPNLLIERRPKPASQPLVCSSCRTLGVMIWKPLITIGLLAAVRFLPLRIAILYRTYWLVD
jgi:hypothetical protein